MLSNCEYVVVAWLH